MRSFRNRTYEPFTVILTISLTVSRWRAMPFMRTKVLTVNPQQIEGIQNRLAFVSQKLTELTNALRVEAHNLA
jgi:hypothetical protein